MADYEPLVPLDEYGRPSNFTITAPHDTPPPVDILPLGVDDQVDLEDSRISRERKNENDCTSNGSDFDKKNRDSSDASKQSISRYSSTCWCAIGIICFILFAVAVLFFAIIVMDSLQIIDLNIFK